MKIPLLFALAGILSAPSWAQTLTSPATTPADAAQTGQKRMYRIALKNVMPSTMAWLLDPTNHPAPPGIIGTPEGIQRTIPAYSGSMSPPPPTAPTQEGTLPAGVDRIVAIDPQNALLAYGTQQGIDNLVPQLDALDKPQRQVEIEAQFYSVKTEDASKLFPQGVPSKKVMNADNTFLRLLQQLEQSGKVHIIAAPRARTTDRVGTYLRDTSVQPVTITNGKFDLGGVRGTPLFLRNSRSVQVAPVINDNETVTLNMLIDQKVELTPSPSGDKSLQLRESDPVRFVAAVRDGASVVTALEQPSEAAQQSYIHFVIIRALIQNSPNHR